jgi:hypothetical protein
MHDVPDDWAPTDALHPDGSVVEQADQSVAAVPKFAAAASFTASTAWSTCNEPVSL